MKRRKQRVNRVFAILFLVVAVAVLVESLFGLGTESGNRGAGSAAFEEFPELPAAPDEEGATSTRVDLLAVYGSLAAPTPVRLAFSTPADLTDAVAAPAVETIASSSGWTGADPPALKLGVVMIASRARRAVLGGRVVGLGDEVQGARVRSIERDHVVATWGARTLTYDLENCWPREFRAECARRTADADGRAAGRQQGTGRIPSVQEGKS